MEFGGFTRGENVSEMPWRGAAQRLAADIPRCTQHFNRSVGDAGAASPRCWKFLDPLDGRAALGTIYDTCSR